MAAVKLFLKGIIIGIANVIPGVSGGTIAVVTGVFDRLIDAVNNFYKDLRKYMAFLVPLGAGACTGIFLFSRIVSYCLKNYSLPTNLFFAGLIAGSLPLIYKEARKEKGVNWIACALGALLVLVLSLAKGGDGSVVITSLTPSNALLLGGVGMIASAAMVMPGVSGSFVLVLLGYYETFINAVSSLNLPVLAVILVGVALGILLISKIIDILLKKAYTVTYSAILGLIAASLFSLLADRNTYLTGTSLQFIIIGAALAGIGFIIALKLGD